MQCNDSGLYKDYKFIVSFFQIYDFSDFWCFYSRTDSAEEP